MDTIKYIFLMLILSISLDSKPVFKNLGMNINTDSDEFLPVVYKDTLYFKRTIKDKPNQEYIIMKIACKDISRSAEGKSPDTISVYSNKLFKNSAKSVDSKESTKGSLSLDPSSPAFYQFSSDKLINGNIFAKPEKLENEISSKYNDMHPAISPDGKFIVFASDRSRTRGSEQLEKDTDLFITYRQKNGSWSKPRNLGKEINTKENEISPFIDDKGNLYYASKGFILDSLNIFYSGESQKSNNLSDIFVIKEKLNYNIIKAIPSGKIDKPFIFPTLLPRPINTEFNEISASVWKDSLLYISSDRLSPFYDRPDPLNQKGYDIFGFLEKETEFDENLLNSNPFFISGYHEPLTPISIKNLNSKIKAGIYRTDTKNSYVADPSNELDESKNKIDYIKHSKIIDKYLKFLAKKIEEKSTASNEPFVVKITAYSDPKPIPASSKFPEQDIIDNNFKFKLIKSTKMDNLKLSQLRAYFTMVYLRTLVEKFPSMKNLKEKIKWEFVGSGINNTDEINLIKRKVKIDILDSIVELN